MGNSHSSKSKAIDKQIKLDEKRFSREVKILLLGAGDSGKSTVQKQMRLIHASGFSANEREVFRIAIFSNIISAMQILLDSLVTMKLDLEKAENWMYEALMLFDTICNSHWFKNTSMILFLNKIDIFKEKLLRSPVSKYFPDYTGSANDFKAAADYFRIRFEKLNRNPTKQIYTHYTVATDTNLLAHVMNAVSDSILHENLQTLLL
ncbi:hypothetical protein EC973_005784 [Apophysomyces ossiformis]|uniref:Uncharacterized protein n=1 Tax=Apophysomyces ossiformis TaxID=679940 RepID=A0A8H7BH29_9FUNG|nr:hypothetical protein EC973_005784 [Apophysomyces ossiformis]